MNMRHMIWYTIEYILHINFVCCFRLKRYDTVQYHPVLDNLQYLQYIGPYWTSGNCGLSTRMVDSLGREISNLGHHDMPFVAEPFRKFMLYDTAHTVWLARYFLEPVARERPATVASTRRCPVTVRNPYWGRYWFTLTVIAKLNILHALSWNRVEIFFSVEVHRHTHFCTVLYSIKTYGSPSHVFLPPRDELLEDTSQCPLQATHAIHECLNAAAKPLSQETAPCLNTIESIATIVLFPSILLSYSQ